MGLWNLWLSVDDHEDSQMLGSNLKIALVFQHFHKASLLSSFLDFPSDGDEACQLTLIMAFARISIYVDGSDSRLI